MLNQPTLEKLHALRLSVMAGAWQDQARNPKTSSLGFDERFALLVEAEHMARDNRRLSRLLKSAPLCQRSCRLSRAGWTGKHEPGRRRATTS